MYKSKEEAIQGCQWSIGHILFGDDQEHQEPDRQALQAYREEILENNKLTINQIKALHRLIEKAWQLGATDHRRANNMDMLSKIDVEGQPMVYIRRLDHGQFEPGVQPHLLRSDSAAPVTDLLPLMIHSGLTENTRLFQQCQKHIGPAGQKAFAKLAQSLKAAVQSLEAARLHLPGDTA